jgi:hypothetical protein
MVVITVNAWYGTLEETSKPGIWGHVLEVLGVGL